MEKSHLVHILRTMDKKEIRELKKWVASPAHNLRQDVVSLLAYLTDSNHLYDGVCLDKEKVFGAVYPGKTFSDAEMRQSMHFLLKAVENFLVYHESQKDEVRTKAYLARVYRQRQLPKLFQKTMENGQQIQLRQPYRNHLYFENEYALQFEEYSYLSGLSRTVPLNLQEVSDANDVAYLANKLRLSCIMLSHQAVFKTQYRLDFLEGLLQDLETLPAYMGHPAIAIYYHQYKAITQPANELHYRELKKQLFEHGSLFPADELRVIYLLAINYTIGRINMGVDAFVRESFELYKSGLEKNIFLENGVLSRFTFNNAVTAALNLKEFEWVKNFIMEYSHYLDEKYRENFVHYNNARAFYEERNYKEAMQLFAQSDYNDILMTLNAKTMLMKMYYELDEYGTLDSLLGSMRTYLQRKQVMGYHKENYKNIIHFAKKMLKVTPYDKAQKEKLRKELQEINPLTERKWLLEQLDKL